MTETDGGFFISSFDPSPSVLGQDHNGVATRKRVLAAESLKSMLSSFGPLLQFEGIARTTADRDDENVGDEMQVSRLVSGTSNLRVLFMNACHFRSSG